MCDVIFIDEDVVLLINCGKILEYIKIFLGKFVMVIVKKRKLEICF